MLRRLSVKGLQHNLPNEACRFDGGAVHRIAVKREVVMNRSKLALAGLFAAAIFAAAPAHADTYTFTLTGAYNLSFELPSNPTVTYSDPGTYFATFPTGGSFPVGTTLSFATSSDDGGFGYYSSGPAFDLTGSDADPVQLFSGDVSSPTILLGNYTLFDFNGQSNLRITEDVSATPLPAALPLFAGGLGIVGFLSRRKKRKAGQALAAA